MDFEFSEDYTKEGFLNKLKDLMETSELGEAKKHSELVLNHIQDLISNSNTKYVKGFKIKNLSSHCIIKGKHFILNMNKSVLQEDIYYDIYICANGSIEFYYNENSLINQELDIVEIIYETLEDIYKFLTMKPSTKLGDCNKRFEELYHNTGSSLKVVVSTLLKEGYSDKVIMGSILNVLKDATWDD